MQGSLWEASMTTNIVYVPRRTYRSEARVINSQSLSRCGTLYGSIKGICAAWHAGNQQTHTRKQVIRIVRVSGILVTEVSKMVSVFWVCDAAYIYCAAVDGELKEQGIFLNGRQLSS